jgi:beta-lactamase superfamily II metal-dependent hydrolase
MHPPKPLRARALLSGVLLASAVGVSFAPSPAQALFTNGKLQVIQLDAGQGDGTVIITPGGQVALIDEGTNFTDGSSGPSCSRVLSELQALGVTHVDLHFASHYHADHVGCITSLSGITIDAGWDRASSYSSATYTNYVNYLGAKRHTLAKGQVFTLDSLSAHPVTITCVALAGDGITTSDENSKSVVLKLTYGEYDEVFGGDLTGYPSGTSSSNTNIETKVGPQVGKVEVYKVHHHGSAYGTYDDWLNATSPKVGVISCGTGNTYGHPTAAALTRLHNHLVRTYWTESGAGAAPNPAWDKVAGGPITIYAVWQPSGVDSILAPGIADTLTNSGADSVVPTVSLLSPNGGETLAAGAQASITWSAADNVGVTTVDVAYSLDDGATWNPLASGAPNAGTFGWTVPNVPTTQGLARVAAHDAAGNVGTAVSNAVFSITDQTPPSVTVTSPNGGESFANSSTQSVSWTAADNVGVESVNLDYSLHGPFGPWTPIQHGLGNTGSTSWTLPVAGSDSAMVRVTAFDHALNQVSDTSDSLFAIAGSGLTGVGPGAVARFALYPAAPSPSAGSVTIRFSLALDAPTRVDVLDVRGRSVWRSGPALLSAGEHSVVWPGLDMSGAAARSGVYFVRLVSGSWNRTTKLVLLR